jgi:hypothetical protein
MEYLQKQQKLANTLQGIGIEVPKNPTGRMGKYLLRGDPKLSRWSESSVFYPQAGEWAKLGVFLGDNLSCLMYPVPGVYWVFKTNDLTANWLNSRSPEFAKLTQENANILGVNPKIISGGFESERKIYTEYSVYDPESGIATVNFPIPSELAYAAILMMAQGVEIKRQDTKAW